MPAICRIRFEAANRFEQKRLRCRVLPSVDPEKMGARNRRRQLLARPMW